MSKEAQQALDKMAENAREMGLDYEQPAPVAEPRKQEPVLWLVNGVVQVSDIPTNYTGCLYTTPPNVATPLASQRQWVGLTDEDVMQTMSGDWTSQFYFARAIEAKLKELNA